MPDLLGHISKEGVNIDNIYQLYQDLLTGKNTCHGMLGDISELVNAITIGSQEAKNKGRTFKLVMDELHRMCKHYPAVHAL